MNLFTLVVLLLYCSFCKAYKVANAEKKYGSKGALIAYATYNTVSQDLEARFGYNIDRVPGGFFDGICTYQPAIGTVLISAAKRFGAHSGDFNASLEDIRHKCAEHSGFEWSIKDLHESYKNATSYAIQINSISNFTDRVLYEPIDFTLDQLSNHWTYYVNDYYTFDTISMYSGIFYLYFTSVFVLQGTSNFLIRCGFHIKLNNRFLKWYRSKMTVPALFNQRHTDSFKALKIFATLIPTRLEAMVILLFGCLNILLTFVNYDFSSNLFAKRIEFYQFMAIKNGKLSFGLMPLLIIFSGRNNLLTSLTAIPYTSLMFYHKWVARIMVIHVILHGAFWTAYAVEHGHLAHYIQEEYWKWGMIATAIVGLLVFQSFHMFKRLSYEVFYILHIILAVAFMLGCFYHCYELGYMEWIYVSCSLWGLDKLTRIVRIILFGVKNAEIKYISDETIRVSVKRNRLFKPFPGAYAFIYFMTPFQFWQSHPFTIINSVHDKDSIVCYVKVKGGITKTLRRKLQKAPGMTVQMKVLVEGPYGHRPPLEKFDSVLLLSGGTGISGLFSHALNLAHHGLSSVKTIHLVWAIKNQESLSWFATELKQLVGSNVKIDIYITGEVSSFPKFEEEEEDDDDEECQDNAENSDEGKNDVKTLIETDALASPESIISDLSSHVTFHYQRPNIDQLIKDVLLLEAGPSVAVVTCGPPKLVDSARRSVAENMMEAKGRLDLFEELQVW